jgi:hypothetical protein
VADFGIAKEKGSAAQTTANLHDGTAPYKVGNRRQPLQGCAARILVLYQEQNQQMMMMMMMMMTMMMPCLSCTTAGPRAVAAADPQ